MTEDQPTPDAGKNPAAVELGRLGGLKGGKARAVKLTAKERPETDCWDELDGYYRRDGWQGPPMGELAVRFSLLVGDRDEADTTLDLRCGRCDRILDKINNRWHAPESEPLATGVWGSHKIPTPDIASGRPVKTKPSIKRFPAAGSGHSPGDYMRMRYECHRKCGAIYVIRLEKLTEAYLDALKHGRNRITAGLDV